MDEDIDSYVRSIKTTSDSIDKLTDEIRTLSEQAQEIIESSTCYDEYLEAKSKFEQAKQKLSAELMGRTAYNDILEKIGTKKEDLKDDKDILSQHLVSYFGRTKEHQIDLGAGKGREVVLKGKLGKEKPYQTSLLGGTNEQ